MNIDLVSYYRERAKEYDRIYSKPDRQQALLEATKILQQIFEGKNVLEIACGTGYWTERIGAVATSVFATDINETVLEIARHKTIANKNISYAAANFYELDVTEKYQSLFGGFICSHIPLQDLTAFIEKVNSLLISGGTMVFIDSIYVEGSNHPIAEKDVHGNTYQRRKLDNGSEHLVLKNFPTEEFLRNSLKHFAEEIRYIPLEYYWILVCKTAPNKH